MSSGDLVGMQMSMVADGPGDALLGAVYAVKLGMTTQDLADTWAPSLTMGKGLRLAAQALPATSPCCRAAPPDPDPATSSGGSPP
jgi:mercuric reductase